jgi:hypothetical protein
MPHNDQGGFHTGRPPKRPTEHKIAGGNHRGRDGCFAAFVLLLMIPLGTVALVAGFVARIVA